MGLLDLWREARGNVLRQQFDDAMQRLKGANEPTTSAFYGGVNWTIVESREVYGAASNRERKTILNHCRKSAGQTWDRGGWPWALGLAICCLNVESEYLPGEDAAHGCTTQVAGVRRKPAAAL